MEENDIVDMLDKLASLRLRIQNGGILAAEDVYAMVDILNCTNVVEDSVLRRSLILLLESFCYRTWQSKEKLTKPMEDTYHVFVDNVIQKIGIHLEELQFEGNVILHVGSSIS